MVSVPSLKIPPPARDTARRVGANRAVNDGQRSTVEDTAALDRWIVDRARRVAAESAVGDGQRCAALVVDAAADSCRRGHS